MKTFQVNIGMGNNTLSTEQLVDFFATHKRFRLIAYTFQYGMFQGEAEETFVALFENSVSEGSTLVEFELICDLLEQESIALRLEGGDVLAFNPNYKGDKYKFNDDFFINLKI
jgi:hypothetical protein